MKRTTLILLIVGVLLGVGLIILHRSKSNTLFSRFDKSDPGLLITMLTAKPDFGNVTLQNCTQLGQISKPSPINIMDLTLLNKKLPVNIYNAKGYWTNFGIILNTDQIIPKSNPSKFVQCMGVRDRGSDLRRCDTDFTGKAAVGDQTQGTYKLEIRTREAGSPSCACRYLDPQSNTCNTKAEVVGCGAKCSETDKNCGEVNWCTTEDLKKSIKNPEFTGLGCAIHPKDMDLYIQSAIAWNKANIKQNWNEVHPENELDVYIEPTEENQKIIIDSIECFVFTEYCGENQCTADKLKILENKMMAVTIEFNKRYKRSVSLYKLRINPKVNVGAYRDGNIVSWESMNYSSDLESLLVKIDLQPKQMKTYRVAQTADGIKSRNTGDIKGDNSYISGEFCARHKDDKGEDTCGTSKITEYTVSYPADYKFGQYALCNQGGAVGGTGAYKCTKCDEPCTNSQCEIQKITCNSKDDCNKDVTRCTPNPGREFDRFAKGYWYSWPEATQCQNLSDLKEGKCKWYLHERTKSIDAAKLQQMGYKMMTNDEMEKNCAKKTTCTEDEIKNFVKNNETNNIKILKEWSRRD